MIYFLQSGDGGNIKIGFTADDDPTFRMRTLQTGNDRPLKVFGTMPGTEDDEDALHMRFAAYKVPGAGKEWFRPVPELLAIIPQSGLPSCGNIEVMEQSVSIRVLTVGRKQFSKVLLGQLPDRFVIDWWSLSDWLTDSIPAGTRIEDFKGTFDLKQYLEGDIWGWVKGDSVIDEDGSRWMSRWVIFVRGGILYKHLDHRRPEHLYFKADYQTSAQHKVRFEKHNKIIGIVYPLRETLPGWRHNDQLYIGV